MPPSVPKRSTLQRIVKSWKDDVLSHHPFEIQGKRVDPYRCYHYVYDILRKKWRTLGFGLRILPKKYVSPSQIFYEEPLVDTMFNNPPIK